MQKVIQMKSLKYPDIPHYEWKGHLLKQTSDYIIVLCQSGRKLIHHTKNKTFTIPVTSLEYFFFHEGYTVAMEMVDGKVKSYYCNIAQPSKLQGDKLCFVDLDLDLVKSRDGEWEVVDMDEFEENSLKYGYPAELKAYAWESLEELRMKISSGAFPFDGSGLALLKAYEL
ncbi:DUF402 domain-containing protein [Terribacillus saccharophilus]|uniref:DUF402 domain-containing protein n=1 Tax=Terribacillus saccharophilus TaxID=361277 RepID=UPI0039828867